MKKIIFNLLLVFYSVSSLGQIDTEFWFAAPDVNELHADRPILIRFASLYDTANVLISMPAEDSFIPIEIQIPPNSTYSLDLTQWIDLIENQGSNIIYNKGILIRSSSPISAYYEVLTSNYLNPEIFALKGRNAIGVEFFTPFQTYFGRNPEVEYYSDIIIVSTEDNNQIIVDPSKDLIDHPAGTPFTIILGKGQTIVLRAVGSSGMDNPMGTKIKSMKPISVTVSEDSVDGPGGCGDLLGDQIVPVNMLGIEYIVPKGSLYYDEFVYCLAIDNETSLFIGNDSTPIVSLEEGQYYKIPVYEPFYLRSSKRIYVYHVTGYGCELGSALIPSFGCSGSSSIGFTRSTGEFFSLYLMVRSGGEDDFSINGNTNMIHASQFAPVSGTNGEWVYANIELGISDIPVEVGQLIENSTNKFHLGLTNGGSFSGCRYGYFSDFTVYESKIVANATEFCELEELIMTRNEIQDFTYHWISPNGLQSQGMVFNIDNLLFENSGYYTLIGSNGICSLIPDSIYITVHPLPADLGQLTTPYVDLDTGLVAYYPFNGNANDESGNGNHGTEITENVSFDVGRFDQAAKFWGYDKPGHIKVNNSVSLQFLNEATFAAWVRLDDSVGMDGWGNYSMNGNYAIIAKDHDRHGYYESVAYHHKYGLLTGAGYDFKPLVNSSSKAVPDYHIGDWIFLTYSLTDTNSSLYINGELDTISTNPVNFSICNTLDLYFGKFSDYWYPFNGALDDVRIYNRALSSEEVQCLYTGDCQQLVLSAAQGETTLCRGGTSSITLFNAQAGVSYQVKDNEQDVGPPQTGNADTLLFNLPDIYADKAFTILATDTATGCSRVLDSVFRVNVVPVVAQIEASLSSDYAPAVVNLNSASTQAVSWNWSVNGEFLSSSEQTQLELDEPGEYLVVLNVLGTTPFQCPDADTITLTLMERINVIFDFPSAFSPNGDGYNDLFFPLAEGIDAYEVIVRDAWGRKMSEFDKNSTGWDGNSIGGAEAPAGPYYYQAAAIDYAAVSHEKSGVVYLVRDMIDLSPNPAEDKLIIEMNGRLKGRKHIKIMHVSGRVVFTTVFDGESLEVDTSWFEKAMYIMQISNDTNIVNVKFIKD